MGKEKKHKIEITEMFVAKPCKNLVFWGIITRSQDEEGNPVLFSRILMPDDGLLCAQESDQKTLANNLNNLARMVVFEKIHSNRGLTKEIFGSDFFLN